MKMVTVREHKLTVLDEVAGRIETHVLNDKLAMKNQLARLFADDIDGKGDEEMLAFYATSYLRFNQDRVAVKRLKKEVNRLCDKYNV